MTYQFTVSRLLSEIIQLTISADVINIGLQVQCNLVASKDVHGKRT